MTFWDRIDFLLQKKDCTGKQLTDYVGVSQGMITVWKNGALPRVDIALKIAEFFDTTVEYLMTGKTSVIQNESVLKIAESIYGLPKDFQDVIMNTISAFQKILVK